MPVDMIELAKKALEEGAGFLLALVIWYYSRRDYNEIIKKLQGILQDRKSDRDKSLEQGARIELRLDKFDRFEEVERQLMKDILKPGPKRREVDKKVLEAITREEGQE